MNKKYLVEVKSGNCCYYRTPTEDELNEALKIEKRRKFLEAKKIKIDQELKEISMSDSKVFFDSPGHPYDIRVFVATGMSDLI